MQFKINPDLCTGCAACLEKCPNGAIFMVNGRAQIDETLCSGCGVCVTACPRQAIFEAQPRVQPKPQPPQIISPAPAESGFKKTLIALGSTLVSLATAHLASNLSRNDSPPLERPRQGGQSGHGKGGQQRRRRGRW